ncbi:PIR protein [Plasmodium vivax]|uniref:VIR protein n=1 Tax=Plasmodium vivax TaxID=5855 RepID=A0A565A5A7_PLAVI|nr:PIR protein [Plasmodium vivax]
MSNYLGDNRLSLIRTKYFYGQLDNGTDGCQNDTFYKLAKIKLDINDGLQVVSDKILKGLCCVYKKKLKNNFESDICKFLYFWLGHILLDKMRNKVVFFDVILDLFNALNDDNIGKICEFPHYYINENNFKNIKFFFDYSEDYNSYKVQLTGNNPSCNYEYKTYLENYVKSYKNIRDECAYNQNRNKYCNEFYQHFNGKNDYYLSNWTCNLQENGQEDPELGEEEEEGSLISAGAGMGVHPVINQNEIPNVTREGEKGPGFSGYISSEINSDLNGVSDPAHDSSPSTIKKIVTSAVSAAGVLVPPFLIYNYAPARSWINKLLGMNKGTNRNPYANPELMADFSMPQDFYSERNRYNIMYNPE